jgi:dihydropteroate synthase
MEKQLQTKLIGILNITPDSFSDGGLYSNEQKAIEKVYSLIADGVDIIDIGAESTRPNAVPVSYNEEFQRIEKILPKIIKIAHENNVLTSIDSYKKDIIKFAIENKIDIVNDQKGLNERDKILLISQHKKKAIIMHSLTIPTDRNINVPDRLDIINLLKSWILVKVSYLKQFDILEDQLIFDPGLGFGKTFSQCFEIIKGIHELQSLGIKICIGHSRKGFLRSIGDQDAMTLALSLLLMERKVDFVRVHDVAAHKKLQNHFY